MRAESHDWDQCPYKRDLKEFPNFFLHVRTQREVSSSQPGRGLSPDSKSAGALILDFSASVLLFISHLVYGIFVIEVQMD